MFVQVLMCDDVHHSRECACSLVSWCVLAFLFRRREWCKNKKWYIHKEFLRSTSTLQEFLRLLSRFSWGVVAWRETREQAQTPRKMRFSLSEIVNENESKSESETK